MWGLMEEISFTVGEGFAVAENERSMKTAWFQPKILILIPSAME